MSSCVSFQVKIWFQNRRTKWKKENPTEQHHQSPSAHSTNHRKHLPSPEMVKPPAVCSGQSDGSEVSPPNSSIAESPPATRERGPENSANAVWLAYMLNQLRHTLGADKGATPEDIMQALTNNNRSPDGGDPISPTLGMKTTGC